MDTKTIEDSKRIAILSVYDKDGIVDRYLEFYIKSLHDVVEKLIIVANGKIDCEKLKKYTEDVYVRPNVGFDAGAYKDVLCSYLSDVELELYDELILCNDTCFGPFISFKEIFGEMADEEVDFWGLKYTDVNIVNHLQSYFLVFRGDCKKDAISYIRKEIAEDIEREEVVLRFEVLLFRYLIKKNYIHGYYGNACNYSPYKSPQSCIAEEKLPMMKKRCFDKFYYRKDNCIAALKEIADNYKYDISMILEYVERIYGIKYNCEYEFARVLYEEPYKYEVSVIDESVLKVFTLNTNKLYIYGTGKHARNIYWYYKEYMGNLQAFIVSDENYEEGNCYEYPILRVTDIDDKEAGIIIALSKKNTLEVKEKLNEYRNVLYLWDMQHVM